MAKTSFKGWPIICLLLGALVFMGQSCEEGCTDSDGDLFAIEGGICGEADCDDTDDEVNPGAEEVCDDGIDNNCDGEIDEEACHGDDDEHDDGDDHDDDDEHVDGDEHDDDEDDEHMDDDDLDDMM